MHHCSAFPPTLNPRRFCPWSNPPSGFYGISLALCHPEQGGREFPSFSLGAGQPRCRGSGHGGRQGAPTARTAWRYRPRHLQPRLPGGVYLRQICKLEHVIFPLSSPGEGLWPERSRQIFEAESGEPAVPCSQLTPRGSLASADHDEIKDAVFAAGIGPRQPLASHGELGISSR